MTADDVRAGARAEIYEERYGFPLKMIGGIAGCVAFVVIAMVISMSTAMRVITIGFFGITGAVLLLLGLSRKVALRVDDAGITLGGSPFRYQATVLRIPWSEVDAVVLWRQQIHTRGGYVSLDYFGIQRRDGSAPARETASGAPPVDEAGDAEWVADSDAEVVANSRAITGFRVDEDRLAAALCHHAPHVALVDRR